MGKFWFNLSRTSTTSILGISIIFGFLSQNIIAYFYPPADANVGLLIIGNINGLACFVAGYYFNKKIESDKENEK